MNELKFRVWDSNKKELFVPHILEQLGTGLWVHGKILIRSIDDCSFEDTEIHKPNFQSPEYGISPFNLMQSTGLKDIHGKEIFEGDIVRVINSLHEIESQVLLVVIPDFYEKKGYDEMELMQVWTSKYLEIFGNKFQNPELIKKAGKMEYLKDGIWKER